MASVIIMPKQGLLMEEGTITKWLVKEGEQTTEGTPLFEMETDKLTITMDSTATGTVLKILHPEGDTVPITQPIAIVGQPGEDISGLLGGDPCGRAPAAAARRPLPARRPRLPRAGARRGAGPRRAGLLLSPGPAAGGGKRRGHRRRPRLRAGRPGGGAGRAELHRQPARRDAAGRQPGPRPGHRPLRRHRHRPQRQDHHGGSAQLPAPRRSNPPPRRRPSPAS